MLMVDGIAVLGDLSLRKYTNTLTGIHFARRLTSQGSDYQDVGLLFHFKLLKT